EQLSNIAKKLGASAELQQQFLTANTTIQVLNMTKQAVLDIATVVCIEALIFAKTIVHVSI
ncbi:hypothetical protein, partial [Psychromonas aquatilis]